MFHLKSEIYACFGFFVLFLILGCGGGSGGGDTHGDPPSPSSEYAPQNLTAHSISSTQVVLDWQVKYKHVDEFHVERSDDGVSFLEVKVVPGTTITFVDNVPAMDAVYYYRVISHYGTNISDPSNTVKATTLLGPSGLTATAGSDELIELSWSDNSNHEEETHIERSIDGVDFVGIDIVKSDQVSYSDVSVLPDTEYHYRVMVDDADGNVSDYSNTDTAATAVIPWATSYGGPGADQAMSTGRTSDGGYILSGDTNSFGIGGYDFWVLKVDKNGDVVWEKTYGGSENDVQSKILQTPDDGYILAGTTYSFDAAFCDWWILKLDESGEIAWQKTFGGSEYDHLESIALTNDGGYVFSGNTTSYGNGMTDCWVLKTDKFGNIQWQKTYGGQYDDLGEFICQTKDDGYVVAGRTTTYGAGGIDWWILKLDNSGDITWQKTYGGGGNEDIEWVIQSKDGGYLVAGHTDSFGAGLDDIWVLKLDEFGSIVWQKAYGGKETEWAESLHETMTGDIIVAGQTRSFGLIDGDIYILNLDANGDDRWQKAFGGPDEDWLEMVGQAADCGYILAGQTKSFSAGKDVWALKLNRDGTLDFNSQSNAKVFDCKAVPVDTSAHPGFSDASPMNSNGEMKHTHVAAAITKCTVQKQAP